MKTTLLKTIALAVSMILAAAPAAAQQGAPSKPATAATKAANEAVLKALPFNDKEDFANAQRGFIGKPDTLTIKSAKAMWSGILRPTKSTSASTSLRPIP
jgi:alkyl sulfatase BDS1-like metallo-beta-lactamase superfamily hydrolase